MYMQHGNLVIPRLSIGILCSSKTPDIYRSITIVGVYEYNDMKDKMCSIVETVFPVVV